MKKRKYILCSAIYNVLFFDWIKILEVQPSHFKFIFDLATSRRQQTNSM